MCGRYGLNHPHPVLKDWYRASIMPELKPRYNIAPTTDILVIREGESSRIGSMMRWGLIPFWAKDLKKVPVMNNARAETVAEKPSFKYAFHERRCIIPASGFFEWKAEGKSKQPYFISARDGMPLSFAGIWGTWTAVDTGESIDSCMIITTTPNTLMETIHDRMPVILPTDTWDTWLSPLLQSDEALLPILKPLDANLMQAWPVSQAVGRVANQRVELIQPM
jgi:putative SOS response-associated peptidase YedK